MRFFILFVIVLLLNIGYAYAYKCEMWCSVCMNQKTACPDTPGRQIDGHQKKMHECGQDCCMHTYVGDLQTRHAHRKPHLDHRQLPEYDAKQNINGKRPECKGEDDCCHNVYDVADAQITALEKDPSCDKERKPECDAQCQQINQQCENHEQQCQQKAKQAKQQYQQQKKGDETHDQELNDCFEQHQKTVEVEKGKQYDLTTPQVNDILDKENKIRYVRDERTSGEHECERMPLDDDNQYKNENIEAFDEGKKKILNDINDDVLRKSPQDEFMTPECIAKAMHEKSKPRLSEQVFNAQCRADEEPDKNCPISTDVVLKRQTELNNERHESNIENARQKTESMAKEANNETNNTKTNAEDEEMNADLGYLYYYDKEVSKKFEIKDKNPHRVARIRKNKEAKQPGIDKAPTDTSIYSQFERAGEKLKQFPLGQREMPLFIANCPRKEVGSALCGWQCAEKAPINPNQRAEAEKKVEEAKQKVFFSDHWQTDAGSLNIVTDQPDKPLLYTGASQNYRDLIAALDDVRFSNSIHVINKKNNMFTLHGWLNNGVVNHDTYYTISRGGKTLMNLAFANGEFVEDSHSRFFWIGPGTTEYIGDFFDHYTTDTNMWHFQSQVYVQQPDFRGKSAAAPRPLRLTFDKRRFNEPDGADITMTSRSWMTLLAKGFFDVGLISDIVGIFPLVMRARAFGDSDVIYNPGVKLMKSYAVRDENDYVYSIRSYDGSTKVHTAQNFIIEDSLSEPITALTTRENRLVYQFSGK